jgi:hypothetical protein
MTSKSGYSKDAVSGTISSETEDYRESVRKMFYQAIKVTLDDEMRKASQEIMEEQRKAIRQVIDEHRTVIRQVVEEEKKAIWEKADALRQSILKMGL